MSKSNFTVYYEADSGYPVFTFHFTNNKMDWAMDGIGWQKTDDATMKKYLREAHATGLPTRTVND